MTLYELTDSFKQLLEMVQDPSIDPEAIADTLEGIEGEIEYKADGYAKVIKELEADTEKLATEIKRLTDRKQALENNIKRMKEALTAAMQATEKLKFKTDLFSFNVQKNPPKLIIDDENNIPTEFYIQPEPIVDKAAIKELLKSGAALSFAHLEQGEGVRIR